MIPVYNWLRPAFFALAHRVFAASEILLRAAVDSLRFRFLPLLARRVAPRRRPRLPLDELPSRAWMARLILSSWSRRSFTMALISMGGILHEWLPLAETTIQTFSAQSSSSKHVAN